MRSTVKKKTRNKYTIRRRVALFSILVCILGIFCVLNQGEVSISQVAGNVEHSQLGAFVEELDVSLARDKSVMAKIYESNTTTGMYEMVIDGNGEMLNRTSEEYGWHELPYDKYSEKLIQVTIEPGVTNIGNEAFHLNNADDENKFTVLESVVINGDITSIGWGAFSGCRSLSSINIPDSVTSIRGHAFEGCTSLSSINIPDSVTSIGGSAFLGCTSLSSINIPDGVASIGDSTFYNCTSLSSINIPDSVTSIEDYAFSGCTSLSSINIPDSMQDIGFQAFRGCVNLKTITIPSSVKTMANYVFSGCTGLQTIDCEFDAKPAEWADEWYGTGNEAKIVWLLPTSITIKQNPQKIDYEIGETLNIAGLVLDVTYTGRTENLTVNEDGTVSWVANWDDGTTDTSSYNTIEEAGISISGWDENKLGTQQLTVNYKEKTANFSVVVRELDRIELDTENVKKIYKHEEELDLEGLVVKAIYTHGNGNNKEQVLAQGEYTIQPANGTKLEIKDVDPITRLLNQTVTVTYKNKTATFNVQVKNDITGIKIKQLPSKTEYIKGEEFDLRGLIIEAQLQVGTATAEVAEDNSVMFSEGFISDTTGLGPSGSDALGILKRVGVEISGFDNTKIGTQNITVTYEGKTITFTVIVRELDRIELDTENVKKLYEYGEELDLYGLEVFAIYTSGTDEKRKELGENDYTVEPAHGTKLELKGTEPGTETLTQTVTVTFEDKTATFDVEVINEVAEIAIKTEPTKKYYIKGEDLEVKGGKITATYQDGSKTDVDMTLDMISGYEKGKTGEQELTVTYEGKTTTFSVEVTNKVTGLQIVQAPSKRTYIKGEDLDLSDGKIKITFEDGSSKELTMDANGVEIKGYDSSKLGTQTLTVSYKGQNGTNATFTVEVTNKVTGISITAPTKTVYNKGQDLDLTGAKITITYEDDSTETKDVTKDMVSGYDKNKTGTQPVTVTYQEKTATFNVTVRYNDLLPSEVEKIELSGNYKTDYIVGDEVDLSGMVIKVTCKDKTIAEIEIAKDGVKMTCDGQTKEYSNIGDAGIKVSPTIFTSSGKKDVSVTYEGKTATFEANVVEDNSNEIIGAELIREPDKTEYTDGEDLDLSGMKVEITYGDGSKEMIDFKEDGKVEITSDGKTTEYDSAADAGITIKPSNLTVGDHKLEITYKDKDIELPVTIKVNPKVVEVTGISLDKTEETIEVGKTAVFVATITPADATNKNVTWTSSDESVAVVSSSGVVTAKKVGTATITVTSDANPNLKAKATITVTAPAVPEPPKVSVTGISLNKTETTIKVGQMEDLVCTITPSNATNKNVKWTSSDEEKVVVDENGTILALAEGQVTITVTSEDGNFTATCIVNAEGEQQETIVEVTGVTLDKSEATIKVGATEKLTATILPENATNKKVTWSSSDESVATVEGGVVTAHKAGKATITVTTEDGKKTATCEVTVESTEVKDETIAVTGVALNKSKTTIKVGNTETLKATITPENATNKNITWSSSDEGVVSVKGGVITAHKEGKATITVTTEDGNKTATCEVTVEKVQAPSDNDDNADKDNNNSNNNNNNNNSNTNNNNSSNNQNGNSTNTQNQDTSPVVLPAAGKGMLAAVIVVIAALGVFSFIKYRNIDK